MRQLSRKDGQDGTQTTSIKRLLIASTMLLTVRFSDASETSPWNSLQMSPFEKDLRAGGLERALGTCLITGDLVSGCLRLGVNPASTFCCGAISSQGKRGSTGFYLL